MADTTTTNLGLIKPDPGASDDTWGIKHNANMDVLDVAIAAKLGPAANSITPTGGELVVAGAIKATGAVAVNSTGAVLAYQGSSLVLIGSWGQDAVTYGKFRFWQSNSSGTLNRSVWEIDALGHHVPGADNSYNQGSGALAIKQIYTNNSVIVTSDARLKTARPYNTKERAVARRCRDLGIVYQWNDAIAAKGADRARMHFGTTVQSVIAAFEAEGLDPMRYGVVCYDEWDAEVIQHPAVEAADAVPARPAVYEERMVDVVIRVNGEDRAAQRPVLVEVQPAVPAQPAVQAREAYTETVREAGNRYSLRLDQLAFFIATAGA